MASHSTLFDDLYLKFPDLVNFVDFVGGGSSFDNEMCSACKVTKELLKNGYIALPTATTDSSSIFLNPLGNSSHGQS